MSQLHPGTHIAAGSDIRYASPGQLGLSKGVYRVDYEGQTWFVCSADGNGDRAASGGAAKQGPPQVQVPQVGNAAPGNPAASSPNPDSSNGGGDMVKVKKK